MERKKIKGPIHFANWLAQLLSVWKGLINLILVHPCYSVLVNSSCLFPTISTSLVFLCVSDQSQNGLMMSEDLMTALPFSAGKSWLNIFLWRHDRGTRSSVYSYSNIWSISGRLGWRSKKRCDQDNWAPNGGIKGSGTSYQGSFGLAGWQFVLVHLLLFLFNVMDYFICGAFNLEQLLFVSIARFAVCGFMSLNHCIMCSTREGNPLLRDLLSLKTICVCESAETFNTQ